MTRGSWLKGFTICLTNFKGIPESEQNILLKQYEDFPTEFFPDRPEHWKYYKIAEIIKNSTTILIKYEMLQEQKDEAVKKVNRTEKVIWDSKWEIKGGENEKEKEQTTEKEGR
jgi:hypothetical protein